jgi:hypothetical protein
VALCGTGIRTRTGRPAAEFKVIPGPGHNLVIALHFQEYFSRSDMVPEVELFVAAYSCTPMLRLKGVPLLANLAESIDVPMVIPCMTGTPTRALSRGS